MEVAIQALHDTYPGEYSTAVICGYQTIFDHHPLVGRDLSGEHLELDYIDLIKTSNKHDIPFNHSYVKALEKEIGRPLHIKSEYPQLYLTSEEVKHPTVLPEEYIVINAGYKDDMPLKHYPYWQEVVDQCDVPVVQIGHTDHIHPKLNGVIDLIGQTNIRQLISVCNSAMGGIGPVTFITHIFGALNIPYICVAGGREAKSWIVNYPSQITMYADTYECCGCYARGMDQCKYPMAILSHKNKPSGGGNISQCMMDIKVEEIISNVQVVKKKYDENKGIGGTGKRTGKNVTLPKGFLEARNKALQLMRGVEPIVGQEILMEQLKLKCPVKNLLRGPFQR